MSQRRRKPRPALPAPVHAERLLVVLPPDQVGMFRFLLEGYDNLACFTVLDRHMALLKLLFSPHQRRAIWRALGEMATLLPLEIRPWPRSAVAQTAQAKRD